MTTLAPIKELNELLDNDGLKCQSKHMDPENRECSIEVTHRMVSSHLDLHVCANHARVKQSYIDSGIACNKCHRPTRDCWRIIPI